MIGRQDQYYRADNVKLSVVREIPAPDHAHLIDREQSVDVKQIPPPVVGAIVMIRCRWFKHGVGMEPLHRNLNHSEYEHVWGRESAESVKEETGEFQGSGNETSPALRELVQVALGVRSEVEEADEQPAHEEERIDAESPVGNCLKKELFLHDLPVLHVIGVFERRDARMAENDPGHRYRSKTVDSAYRVAADLVVADDPYVGANGEREQQFLQDT